MCNCLFLWFFYCAHCLRHFFFVRHFYDNFLKVRFFLLHFGLCVASFFVFFFWNACFGFWVILYHLQQNQAPIFYLCALFCAVLCCFILGVCRFQFLLRASKKKHTHTHISPILGKKISFFLFFLCDLRRSIRKTTISKYFQIFCISLCLMFSYNVF